PSRQQPTAYLDARSNLLRFFPVLSNCRSPIDSLFRHEASMTLQLSVAWMWVLLRAQTAPTRWRRLAFPSPQRGDPAPRRYPKCRVGPFPRCVSCIGQSLGSRQADHPNPSGNRPDASTEGLSACRPARSRGRPMAASAQRLEITDAHAEAVVGLLQA